MRHAASVAHTGDGAPAGFNGKGESNGRSAGRGSVPARPGRVVEPVQSAATGACGHACCFARHRTITAFELARELKTTRGLNAPGDLALSTLRRFSTGRESLAFPRRDELRSRRPTTSVRLPLAGASATGRRASVRSVQECAFAESLDARGISLASATAARASAPRHLALCASRTPRFGA